MLVVSFMCYPMVTRTLLEFQSCKSIDFGDGQQVRAIAASIGSPLWPNPLWSCCIVAGIASLSLSCWL